MYHSHHLTPSPHSHHPTPSPHSHHPTPSPHSVTSLSPPHSVTSLHHLTLTTSLCHLTLTTPLHHLTLTTSLHHPITSSCHYVHLAICDEMSHHKSGDDVWLEPFLFLSVYKLFIQPYIVAPQDIILYDFCNCVGISN